MFSFSKTAFSIQGFNNGNDTVKLERQFEKLDYKYRKLLLDLGFL